MYARIRHVLLPKDYVRFRLTGERTIDAADASGTLLFDVAHRRWSDEVCDALEMPLEWLPPALRVDRNRRRRRPGGGRARRRHRAAGAALRRARDLGGRLRGSPGLRARTARALHLFCHAVPGTWHAMGVMLSAAGSLAWLRRCSAPTTATLDAEAERWPPGSRACCSRPISRASGRRTPTRTRAAHSSGSRSATTAARSRARCSKASRTGCATRSSCYATSGSGPAAASPAAARGASSGCGSSHRCSAPARDDRVGGGLRYGAALLAGVRAGVFADAADAVARCVRVATGSSPSGTTRSTTAIPPALPDLRLLEEARATCSPGKATAATRLREPRHRRRGGSMSTAAAETSASPRAAAAISGSSEASSCPCDVRNLDALVEVCEAMPNASAASTSSSRTRRRRLRPVPRNSPASTLTRC